MNRKILALIVAMSLLCTFSSDAAAGVLGYSLRGADKEFKDKPAAEPGAAVVAADMVFTRPVGLALTLAGTGAFLVTLPISIPSNSVGTVAHGFIVKPGGYTFVRPLGRSEERFEEKGVFPQYSGPRTMDYQR
jgi:hypothetical protein